MIDIDFPIAAYDLATGMIIGMDRIASQRALWDHPESSARNDDCLYFSFSRVLILAIGAGVK
jgi:hypothetical protein